MLEDHFAALNFLVVTFENNWVSWSGWWLQCPWGHLEATKTKHFPFRLDHQKKGFCWWHMITWSDALNVIKTFQTKKEETFTIQQWDYNECRVVRLMRQFCWQMEKWRNNSFLVNNHCCHSRATVHDRGGGGGVRERGVLSLNQLFRLVSGSSSSCLLVFQPRGD